MSKKEARELVDLVPAQKIAVLESLVKHKGLTREERVALEWAIQELREKELRNK